MSLVCPGGAPVVVLTVVMCSTVNWSADVTLGGVDSEFMSLPLVLVRGPVRLSNLLFTWWQVQTFVIYILIVS